MTTQSGVFMPTAEERKQYVFGSDIVKARYGFVVGEWQEDGKEMNGALAYKTNEYGEIEWEYMVWETDPKINVLEPVVEFATSQTIKGTDYLVDVCER